MDIDNMLNLEEPDFMFGEDGDIIEVTLGQRVSETPVATPATGGAPMHNDAGASARVRQEHEGGQQGGAQVSSAAISHPLCTASLFARHTSVLFVGPFCTHRAHTPCLTQGDGLSSSPQPVYYDLSVQTSLFLFLFLFLFDNSSSYAAQLFLSHRMCTMSLPKVTHIIKALVGDHMDLDLPVYEDDLPELQATSSAVEQQPAEHSEQVIESASSAAAPLRRKKKTAKALPKDRKLELSNNQILAWKINYLDNMKEAARARIQKYAQQQAKKNAEYYVWGAGIGGLGRDHFAAQGPLAGFMGDNLFELFTGKSRNPKTISKRDRDSGIDEGTQQEARSKRQKTVESEEEVARGQDDEGLFMLGGDEEVELPREAVSALDDQQIFSAMPWNISASKRGSSAVPVSGRITILSEQGRQGSRAGSRMVSASPLLGRSTGRFEALQSLDSDALGGDDFAFEAPTSDPTEPEEGATQASLRVREALSAEGENFFAFVAEAIANKINDAVNNPLEMPNEDQIGAIEVEQVTFEELLPPAETSKMIACQGFLMLLSLGTKGMLDVQQPNAFEDITLKLTEKAKAMQIVEVDGNDGAEPRGNEDMGDVGDAEQEADEEGQDSSTEASGEGDVPQPDDSHFQEQIAAGHAAAGGDDDHDSLCDSH